MTFKGFGEIEFKGKYRYSNYEDFFNVKNYAFGGTGEATYLQPGVHQYPFHFTLAQRIPRSFEGDYGIIRYMVKAAIDQPGIFSSDLEVNSFLKELPM